MILFCFSLALICCRRRTRVKARRLTEGKKDEGSITVVLKIDMRCEGCSKKSNDLLRVFKGIEDIKGDDDNNKLTMVGKVDPLKLQERVEQKMKKKVELISPIPSSRQERVLSKCIISSCFT
ncbi:PREDICTED: heavy metal-associated isoprenylated plant protein 3-like [Nelumbo nucifera]|uniref:Heavy metal-associated isoprenylated plant protein 3-like n=1 Tax=Nelumbo nucifera TaxID=4432 RepID=A0A1U8B3Z0_NELNU|nr:PREDICTED: heavy metal-associated isoprenylated plant protein 3-like [Nelumbo nucifera]